MIEKKKNNKNSIGQISHNVNAQKHQLKVVSLFPFDSSKVVPFGYFKYLVTLYIAHTPKFIHITSPMHTIPLPTHPFSILYSHSIFCFQSINEHKKNKIINIKVITSL